MELPEGIGNATKVIIKGLSPEMPDEPLFSHRPRDSRQDQLRDP
jgi:hypothetical protein